MNIFFRSSARELAARFFVGSLFAILALNILADFIRTRHVTGLLLVASEALVVVLTVVRRPASAYQHSSATTEPMIDNTQPPGWNGSVPSFRA